MHLRRADKQSCATRNHVKQLSIRHSIVNDGSVGILLVLSRAPFNSSQQSHQSQIDLHFETEPIKRLLDLSRSNEI
jgi:hypothetical protein